MNGLLARVGIDSTDGVEHLEAEGQRRAQSVGCLILGWVVIWLVIGGGIGAWNGNYKGRAAEGFVLGFLLSPIGWIIAALTVKQVGLIPAS